MEEITLREIIDYARINEENSKRFYLEAAEKSSVDNVRAYLQHLAKEEQKHIDHLNELEKKAKDTPRGTHYEFVLDKCQGCKKCAEACPCGYIDMF